MLTHQTPFLPLHVVFRLIIVLLRLLSVTEEDEAVANNASWSPRGTPNFDLSGSGKLE